MNHRILFSIFIGLGLLVPVFSQAATVEELRAQIMQLLQRIDALQAQTGGGATVGGTTISPTTPSGVANCPHISRVLKRGASGADVSRLQQFLASDPSLYPEAQVSGYYGALTEAAVKRFQCKNKLVCDGTPESTGYGVTGPRTAALLALQCAERAGGASSDVGGFIKVTPTSGAAPLPVTVEATVNTTRSCTGAVYEVDFGDGTAPAQIVVPAQACAELRQVFTHNYVSGGTFTVTLRSGAHRTTATVSVSGNSQPPTASGDTFQVSATSGTAPFSVTFTGVINAHGVCNSGPYQIRFGNGQEAVLPQSGCTPSTYTVTHVYQEAGNYLARLQRGSPSVDIANASIVVAAGAPPVSYGGYFSVTPSVGNDNGKVDVQFDIQSSCAAYDLDWGDNSAKETQPQGTCSAGAVTKTFTHDYQFDGGYTITLKRGSSLQTTDTAAITISQ